MNLAFTHLDNLLVRTDSKGKFSLACDLVKIITFEMLLVFLPILLQFFAQYMEKSNDQSFCFHCFLMKLLGSINSIPAKSHRN